MSDKKDDTVYLHHIQDCIKWIESYIKDADYDTFKDDHMMQDACVRQIEIIGEATKQFSKFFKEKFNYVPWRAIAGMRDKMIHDYLGVNIEEVWDTVKNDIPYLKKEIIDILSKIEH